jgi:hypothetical protein
MKSFIICTLQKILLALSNQEVWDGRGLVEIRNMYTILVATSECKSLLGRLRRSLYTWEDDIKMDHVEKVYDYVECMHPAHDRIQWRALLDAVMDIWFHERRAIS